MPMTRAPRSAMASASIPPPQPTSSTRLSLSAARRSMWFSRNGLISCSGLNSARGSHQRCASSLNFSSSRGSAFCIDSETREWRLETRRRVTITRILLGPVSNPQSLISNLPSRVSALDLFLPPRGFRGELGGIKAGQASMLQLELARHPHVAHMLSPGGVDQVRHRVETRSDVRRTEVDRRYIREFSGRK